MLTSDQKSVLVLGASGLIGHAIAIDLARRGHKVTAVARRFTPSQRFSLEESAREMPLVDIDSAAMAKILAETEADVVVNCVGLLQTGPGGKTGMVHVGFVDKLLEALRTAGRPILLVHISVPGNEQDDRTDFSRSKREAERLIAASGVPHVILRPGFVFARTAFGGSALLRALAAVPVTLPKDEGDRPFSYIAVEDLIETVDIVVRSWDGQSRAVSWDVMHREKRTVAQTIQALRRWLGTGSARTVALPKILLDAGAMAGDLAGFFGWSPPIRSAALAELRRGVDGDSAAWLAATGITPRSLDDLLSERPASVQEKWFARLYFLKAVIIVSLVIFWCASAIIVLAFSYRDAVRILTSHGFAEIPAQVITVAGSVMDFLIGIAIAFRRTSRFGLVAGIAVSLFYMVVAAILTPDLWVEPLGALVKTFPAIVLMLVALAISNDR